MVIFHHIFQVNHWSSIAEEQQKLISALPDHQYRPYFFKKDEAMNELPTLQHLWDYCVNADSNEPVCYIHTKGVTAPGHRKSRLWRETLNYWILHKWKDNLHLLATHDLSGARAFTLKLDGIELPHYSGNFWWATSDYIKKLPSPIEYLDNYRLDYSPDGSDFKRFGCEFWVGSSNARLGVVDNFPINHIDQIGRYEGIESFRRLKRKFG